jgi:hypothetical protein
MKRVSVQRFQNKKSFAGRSVRKARVASEYAHPKRSGRRTRTFRPMRKGR